MNKGELVDSIYEDNGLTRDQCREVIDKFVDAIVSTVAEGEKAKLVNFGTFEPGPRRETVKRHPVTGEKIEVPAKVVPKFSPGKGFKETLAGNLKAKKDGSGELVVKQK